MRNLLKEKIKEYILSRNLEDNGITYITNIALAFQISQVTARRYVNILIKEGVIEARKYGNKKALFGKRR